MPKRIVGQTYFTLEELAARLGLPTTTLRLYVRQGRLRASKLGKSYHVTEEDLNAFLCASKLGKPSHSTEEDLNAFPASAQPAARATPEPAPSETSALGVVTPAWQMKTGPHGPSEVKAGAAAAKSVEMESPPIECQVAGVAVRVWVSGGHVWVQLASADAATLHDLVHEQGIKVLTASGNTVAPMGERCCQEDRRWVYRAEFGPTSSVGPKAKLIVASRLVPGFERLLH